MDNSLYQVDKRLVRESFDRAASGYDEVAILQQEIGQRLLERLDLIKLAPQRIVDIGAGTGQLTTALSKRYKNCEVIALDLAPSMLKLARQRQGKLNKWFDNRQRFVCGDAEHLPLADNSVDMVFSNFAIQWCSDLDQTFREFRRVLKPGGLLLFTTFGPDTLKELRQAWRNVDENVHVNSFIDMHDIGDALLRVRLANPVMDVERLVLTYSDAIDVMRDLKAMGAHNVTSGRNHTLTGKMRLQQVINAYQELKTPDGKVPATYEVVYGHAWNDNHGEENITGTVKIPISHIRHRGG